MCCNYQLEREVNQIIWNSFFNGKYAFGQNGNNYENDVFEIKSYNWNDEDDNDYHFYHKPSGIKIYWHKYPLRSPMCNKEELTHEQFLNILKDCWNSLKTCIYYDVEKWWKSNKGEEQ